MPVFENFPYTNFHDLNLDWILQHLKALSDDIASVMNDNAEIKKVYENLIQFQEDITNGNISPGMKSALEKWASENIPILLENAVKSVYFGLADSGYFVAYIPDSWNDIIFNTTGYDITVDIMPEYGHLILSMEVN